MNVDHRLTETVTYSTLTGRDASGDPTYSAQTTTKSRVDREAQIIRAQDGRDVESTTVLHSIAELPVDARVWLPGADTGNVGAALTVLRSGPIKDLGGNVVMYRAFL